MNENAKSRHDVAEDMATEARAMAADGVQALRDGVETVRDGVQTAREKGADAVAKAGTAVSDMAQGAADSLASTARYVREHQAKEMVGHVEALIRVHPGKALLAAVAVGFVAGRALRRG